MIFIVNYRNTIPPGVRTNVQGVIIKPKLSGPTLNMILFTQN